MVKALGCEPRDCGFESRLSTSGWITKDNKSKKVKKEELEYYISLGYTKGRK